MNKVANWNNFKSETFAVQSEGVREAAGRWRKRRRRKKLLTKIGMRRRAVAATAFCPVFLG